MIESFDVNFHIIMIPEYRNGASDVLKQNTHALHIYLFLKERRTFHFKGWKIESHKANVITAFICHLMFMPAIKLYKFKYEENYDTYLQKPQPRHTSFSSV